MLVVAKNDQSLSLLGIAMQAREIKREYLGLVHGTPDHERGRLDGPIGRDPQNRLKYAIVGSGKHAVTHYEVREVMPKHAELIFRLETGRTHQLRAQAAARGLPIVALIVVLLIVAIRGNWLWAWSLAIPADSQLKRDMPLVPEDSIAGRAP